MTNNTINGPRDLLENIVLCYNEGEFELGTLAAECHALLSATSPAGVDGLDVVAYLIGGEPSLTPCRVRGVVNEPLCRLSDATAIIDGLRGEVEEWALRSQYNADTAQDVASERDQHAKRIGELEWLLDHASKYIDPGAVLTLIKSTLSAGKDSAP